MDRENKISIFSRLIGSIEIENGYIDMYFYLDKNYIEIVQKDNQGEFRTAIYEPNEVLQKLWFDNVNQILVSVLEGCSTKQQISKYIGIDLTGKDKKNG